MWLLLDVVVAVVVATRSRPARWDGILIEGAQSLLWNRDANGAGDRDRTDDIQLGKAGLGSDQSSMDRL